MLVLPYCFFYSYNPLFTGFLKPAIHKGFATY